MHVSRSRLILACLCLWSLGRQSVAFDVPAIDFAPRQYLCLRAATPPVIDGELNEAVWALAPWTQDFVDIEGQSKQGPALRTRAKMLWDAEYFYVAAQLDEPQLWATLEQRDAIIYHDNDFELFIDPNGDTWEYYELEINALNTCWDLFLTRPYRDGGTAIHAWDIAGLKSAVQLRGTLNDPRDRDEGWSVEIALPWRVLAESARVPAPPETGAQWRVNFSRVEWDLDVVDGEYIKREGPEHNWVWSPQGLVNMHYPELWGYVHFVERLSPLSNAPDPLSTASWALRRLYYAQRSFYERTGGWAVDPSLLDLPGQGPAQCSWPPQIRSFTGGYQAELNREDGRVLSIDQWGRLATHAGPVETE